METKYTIDYLIAEDVVIECKTEAVADLIEIWAKSNNLLKIQELPWSEDAPCAIFDKSLGLFFVSRCTISDNYKIIPASEFFEKKEKVLEDNKEKADKVIIELNGRLDKITPSVIIEATNAFDRFTAEWNKLYHKAEKLKSIKGLDTLTKKTKELL